MTLTAFLLLLATPGTSPSSRLKLSVLQVTLQTQYDYPANSTRDVAFLSCPADKAGRLI